MNEFCFAYLKKTRPFRGNNTEKKIGAIAIKSFALLAVLAVVIGMLHFAMAQDTATPYPKMAPINQ